MNAEVIFLIGANPTVNHPVAATWIKNAAKAGVKLIVADPRRGDLARHATYNLQFNADTDVALLNAMLHVIVEEGLVDEAFIRDRTAGYEALAGRPDFTEALERLIAGSADTTLCLMCAEKEPLDCHRTVLVSRRLAERGAAIEHLLADGKHKPHAVLEEELLEAGEGGAPDLFTSAEDRSQRLARAWQKRERAMKRA